MNRLISEYQELIELLYDRLGHLEILQFPSQSEKNVLEEESIQILRKAVSWYGGVPISTFGLTTSTRATKLILLCNSNLRFQTLYFHLMLQDRKNYTQSDISILARKLGIKNEGKQL
jgi:hypothetical protein